MTLKESLKVAENVKAKIEISKKYIADYLENKYGKTVVVNRRANMTKLGRGKTEGLPLADTHYSVINKEKKCFTDVYEINGAVLILVKAPKDYAKTLQESHRFVTLSTFPKSKDTWYPIAVDDSWTEESICKMLDDVKTLTDNPNYKFEKENSPVEPIKEANVQPAQKTEKVFNINVRYEFVEELNRQNKKIQALYKEIVEYVLSKANVREFDSKYLIKFKWGRNDLMHVKFKRGEIECSVMAGSSELKRYALLDNGTKIKEQPTKIHPTNETSLQAIKDLIDISYTNIEEARKKID